MRLLIDGYNLCHALGLLHPKTGPPGRAGPHELEKARRQLLGQAAAWCGGKNTVMVVFDAAGAPPGFPGEEWHHGVHVRYALHESADDVIEDVIAHDSDPRRLTVVSDDHRIQQAARRRHCEVWGTEQYEEALKRLHRDKLEQARPQQDKPEAISQKEAQQWLEAFGDVEVDGRDPPRRDKT